jgi:hypothetical protein
LQRLEALLDDEPAFAWWVPYTLRRRDIILSKVKARVRKTTHEYGILQVSNMPMQSTGATVTLCGEMHLPRK